MVTLCGSAVSCRERAVDSSSLAGNGTAAVQTFLVKGIVNELKPDGRTVVIKHQAISNYMAAMTMPFTVKEPKDLAGLIIGDEISFRLWVNEEESWIDNVTKAGQAVGEVVQPIAPPTNAVQSVRQRHALLDYKFTNELGAPISLSQFHGQGLAITFFFTRCPVPEYCPRLSKNFAEASRKLSAMPRAPTNWHFLSVSFDAEFDTPAVLKAYGERYQYDPTRWSFMTGPADKINELARLSDVNVEREGSLFNHNFRTLIIDAAGRLQMNFPVGGNLSDAIVEEILKAAAATNRATPLISTQPNLNSR